MGKRVLLIQGHPDTAGGHLCRALEEAYAKGAAVGGHELRRIDIGSLDFLEQVERPGFAFSGDASHPTRKALKGRSARLVVTMGMPAFVYRLFFRAHSVKSLRRNVLGFVGIGPVGDTLIGMTDNMQPRRAARWLDRLFALGRAGV
jgi:putative NADPH-quinone reductase